MLPPPPPPLTLLPLLTLLTLPPQPQLFQWQHWKRQLPRRPLVSPPSLPPSIPVRLVVLLPEDAFGVLSSDGPRQPWDHLSHVKKKS